jgi:hypothetical protein
MRWGQLIEKQSNECYGSTANRKNIFDQLFPG